MNKFHSFIFENYSFNKIKKELTLSYSLDSQLIFTEKYIFNFDFVDYDPLLLDRALYLVFLIAGISYYKTYVPSNIIIKYGDLDKTSAEFLNKLYQRGLGEFWYVNGLDPRTKILFPHKLHNIPAINKQKINSTGTLIGLGGGKDSLLTIEALRSKIPDLYLWSLGHQAQLAPLAKHTGLPYLPVERQWDKQLLTLNKQGAYNGHIPISALFAAVGAITAILSGCRDTIVSNEHSANEANFLYDGVSINHQYSKSQEFEQDFQVYLKHMFGNNLRYYSFLRPLSELHIAELFSKYAFKKYKLLFSSCNRAFVESSDKLFWCGKCPKCAFVFLILTPFIDRIELESLWKGRNLLLDKKLVPLFKQLLGIDGTKPLDCIGEIKESRSAMRICQSIYPELNKIYSFDVPEDYDYHKIQSDEMPPDILKHFKSLISKVE